jgi:hypothetical protein
MDKLFSSIQQTLQPNDKNSLLQNQQLNQDKINDLLNKSAEALLCGPDCQKMKITDELKQKYLDAETNIQIAPIKLEQTKKNYYVYKEGRPFYDNMLEEELKQKAEKISELLGESFNEEVSSANTMNQYLNTALINSEYTSELFKKYTSDNQELKLQLRNSRGDILTNDRKTYYETEALTQLKLWYRFWWYIYYILILVFTIALFVSPSQLTMIKKVVLFVLLIFYPYYIDYIVRWVQGLYMSIYNRLPKNVYNDL